MRCAMSLKALPRRTSSDTYMSLIQRFPLKTIKNDTAHGHAVEVIADLMGRKLDEAPGNIWRP